MKKTKNAIYRAAWFAIILMILCLAPSLGLSESRGIKVVAEDKATKEWKEIFLYNKTYAVIIGIDSYPNLSPEFQLSYAVSDAKAIERMLRSKYLFNQIYTLYNEQATKSNILDLLLNKLSRISKDDSVFVFFAGHGGQEETDYGPMGFIVPCDGDFTDMRKVISMTTIRDDISKRIKAKHVFFTMDSCYSGILVTKRSATSKETRRDLAYLQQIAKEPVRQVLTAGSANQKVLDGGPGGHSVFAGRFLEILDEADDFITANEISTLVKERVFSDAKARGHVQTPKSGDLFGLGDFIFMPSMTKKLGNIENQISDLEKELNKIKEAEIRANQHQDKSALREAERIRKIAEAKLQAKKLEEQRLRQEKEFLEKREQERRKRLAEQKIKEKEEATRLAALQREVELKRKKYKSSMVLSLDDAIREMQTLDKEIKDIRSKFIDDLKKKILTIAKNHSENYTNVVLEKDEFETEAEYQARLKKRMGGLQSTNQTEFANAMMLIETAYKRQIEPLLQQMKEISANEYPVYGHDALKIKLGKYSADTQSFKITIASKNIKRPIYSQGRFLIISSIERQARNAGIRKGDILISYNNIMVKPGVNWDRLKQTVITDNVVMEVDRDGKLMKFNLKKGSIGINSYVDDYLKNLEANQFVVNGDLQVPRTEARKFKQNYLNGFITAELKVSTISPFMTLITKAEVVDESNDKRYDIFGSRFSSIGNGLIYDTKNKITWLTYYPKKLNFKGTSKYVKQFEYKGIKGWTIPSLGQMKSLKDTADYYDFNFSDKWFYTSTLSGRGNNHWQYQPRDNDRDNDYDTDKVRFAMVFPWGQNIREYDLFNNRFIKLNNSLLFDAESKLLWFTDSISNKKFTYIEAEKFVKQFEYQNLKGWRLPTYNEFSILFDYSIPGINKIFRFSDKWFYTSTLSGRGNNHWQYQPRDNDRDNDYDTNKIHVVGVM